MGADYDLRLYRQPLSDCADHVYFRKNKILCDRSNHPLCHHVHSLLPAGNGELAGYSNSYDARQLAGILSAPRYFRSDYHLWEGIPCSGCVPPAVCGFDHGAGSCDLPGIPEETDIIRNYCPFYPYCPGTFVRK